jgi:two-component system NtrC family sensor kinase
MVSRLQAILQSLSLRLLLPLFLTAGAVLGVYAVVSFHSTRNQLLDLVAFNADRSSDLILRATHDGMLLNRKDEVQRTLERLGGGEEVAGVRVYDKQGDVFLSSVPGEIGTRLDIRSSPCVVCHGPEGRRTPAALVGITPLPQVVAGDQTLRHLTVIPNEPGCSQASCHAHPPDKTVLGVLDVEMSMAPVHDALNAARRRLVWTAVALILVTGVVSTLFLERGVLRPVAELRQGTRRIASGDLDTRIAVSGQDELAQLAEAFNQMADDLRSARQEVVGWSQKLEEKVVAKTEELRRTQRQVLHMERMASLGRLSATVAHELNNPISGILMYARLVERELGGMPIEKATKDELARYLQLVQSECSRCGDIVKNLLLFARKSGAEMALIDVNEVVERSIMLVRHHLEISNVTLARQLLEGDSQIVADAGQLQQALVALLVNAVEAMSGPGGGGGELSVRVHAEGDAVVIDIADTGVGIPTEVVPHIFEPFFSTKDEERGVGLGLAVVYGIIRRHGGRIEVDSEVGRGTAFRVQLPRHPPEAGADAEKG